MWYLKLLFYDFLFIYFSHTPRPVIQIVLSFRKIDSMGIKCYCMWGKLSIHTGLVSSPRKLKRPVTNQSLVHFGVLCILVLSRFWHTADDYTYKYIVYKIPLTQWGRVTHICVVEMTIIVSDNGLSPGRCQAIIWINAGILFIGHYGTNFSENLIKILTFSFTNISLKVSSATWRPFCLGLNVLISHELSFS